MQSARRFVYLLRALRIGIDDFQVRFNVDRHVCSQGARIAVYG